MAKTPKEREQVSGNMLSLATSRFQPSEPVTEDDDAVAFMPPDVTIEKARRLGPAPAEPSVPAEGVGADETQAQVEEPLKLTPNTSSPSRIKRVPAAAPASKPATRRISLFFDDEMMLRLFKYSVSVGRDPKKALRRLIDESLAEKGF
ncbi:hypothetical protein [Ensifer aridi]|uniref:hypothetical protein n=1 Tax=Ensifer aridi TaxID=1708715 RepID=UPI000A120FFC|nr:hypothetical protein [Ensifer aridi]